MRDFTQEEKTIDNYLRSIATDSPDSLSTVKAHVNDHTKRPFFDRMVGEKLIKIYNTAISANNLSLTNKGRRVMSQGGYLKHLERKHEKQQRLDEIEQLQVKLSRSNLAANHFQTRMARKANRQAGWAIALSVANLVFFIWQIFRT